MRDKKAFRPSRVLEKVRAGGVVVSVKSNLADPRVVDIIGRCGFDCFWTCMEHVPNSIQIVEEQIRAAKAHDMDTVVRVRRGSYSDLILPLEMDATGIMVPHVMSVDDARQVVRQTRFHPMGRRPLDGGNADGAYCALSTEEYIRLANEQRFVILQIEDPEPMNEIEEIAQIEGVDFLMFGPNDFGHGLGVPGQMDDPRIDQTRRKIAEICRRNGKFAATTGNIARLREYIDMGYQFVNIGGDVSALSKHFLHLAETARNELKETSA